MDHYEYQIIKIVTFIILVGSVVLANKVKSKYKK